MVLPHFYALLGSSQEFFFRVFSRAKAIFIFIQTDKQTVNIRIIVSCIGKARYAIPTMGRSQNLNIVFMRCLENHIPEYLLNGIMNTILDRINKKNAVSAVSQR